MGAAKRVAARGKGRPGPRFTHTNRGTHLTNVRWNRVLILLDLMMPEVDGFEFLEELRRNLQWRSIPVVVVTAKELTEEDHQRLNGYVERVIQKGAYRGEALLAEVRRLVAAYAGQKRATRVN